MRGNTKWTYHSLGSNRDNMRMLSETLNMIKSISFDTLYNLQKVMVGLDIIPVKRDDIVFDTEGTWAKLNVPYEFIKTETRKIFFHSKFYNKRIYLHDIRRNPKIFQKYPMLFIDGNLFTEYTITPKEDLLEIYFDTTVLDVEKSSYISQQKLKSLSDGDMNIVILPNKNIEVKQGFGYNEAKDSIDQMGYLTKDQIQSIYTDNSNAMWFLQSSKYKKYYRMVHNTYSEEPGSQIPFNKITLNDNTLLNLIGSGLTNGDSICYSYPSIYYSIKLSQEHEYFTLHMRNMPVPSENMLIFSREAGSNNPYLLDTKTKISIQYPNIYKVTRGSSNTELVIYVLYEESDSAHSMYSDELSLAHRIYADTQVLDQKVYTKAQYDTDIPDILKNYDYLKFKFSNADLGEFNDKFSNTDILNYYLDKFKNIIKKDPWLFEIYNGRYVDDYYSYYVKFSSMKNLSSYVRNNNYKEIKDPGNRIEFDEPHYVVTINKGDNIFSLECYLDGYLQSMRNIHESYTQYFIYIPVSKVRDDSVLEILRIYTQDIGTKEFVLDDTTTKILVTENTLEKMRPIDLMVYSKNYSTPDAGFVIPLHSAENHAYIGVYYKDADGNFIEVEDPFYRYDNLYLGAKDSEYIGRTMYVKSSREYFRHILTSQLLRVPGPRTPFTYNQQQYRVYKGGRLISSINKEITGEVGTSAEDTISFNIPVPQGNYEIDFIYSPMWLKEVFSVDNISARDDEIGSKGYVDLVVEHTSHGAVYPLSFKTYDFYLNGVKLNPWNVDILSPHKMVIKGVPSTINFKIFLRDRSNSLINFNIDTFSISVEDDAFTNNPTYRNAIREYINNNFETLQNTLPDINRITTYDIISIFNEFLKDFDIINPDINQLDDPKYYQMSKNVFDEKKDIFIDPDTDKDMDNDFVINPDQE